MEQKTKICKKCEQEKELSEFYHKCDTKDGYASSCKKCQDAYKKTPKVIAYRKKYNFEYSQKHKEELKKYNKRRYEENKDKILQKSKEYYASNRNSIRKRRKERYNENPQIKLKALQYRNNNKELYKKYSRKSYYKHRDKNRFEKIIRHKKYSILYTCIIDNYLSFNFLSLVLRSLRDSLNDIICGI